MAVGETTLLDAPVVRIGERYELRGVMGSGGMATVYRARDFESGKEVAVKVLREELSQNEDAVARFEREGQLLTNLPPHPNLVSVLDVGEDRGRRYLVMELVDGGTLKDNIVTEAPLSPERATHIAAEVAAGLAFAHEHGLVHRDVKPQNVLIGAGGVPKVGDFGIAFTSQVTQMTQAGTVFGTAHYLSPEQATGKTATSATDVYALGIILYEMLTGSVPFDADNHLSIALMHVDTMPDPPSKVNTTVPRWLDGIVLRALAKDPAARFPDASALRSALLAGLARPRARPVRVSRETAALAAAVAALAIAGVVAGLAIGASGPHPAAAHRGGAQHRQLSRPAPPPNELAYLSISNATPAPGQAVIIGYRIDNSSTAPFSERLHASLIDDVTHRVLSDPANASVATVRPGTLNYSRQFVVPSGALAGTYTLLGFLTSSRTGAVLGTIRVGNVVQIGPQAPPPPGNGPGGQGPPGHDKGPGHGKGKGD